MSNGNGIFIAVRNIVRTFGSVWGVVFFLVLSGCAGGLSQNLKQSLSVVAPVNIDFVELNYYAQRSASAYKSANDIREAHPLTTRVATVQPIDVRYFIETDIANREQTLSVRGTAEKPNVWQDIEITLIPDSVLGISLHSGFQTDAVAILEDASPHLRKDFSLRITGHSLGGAVAVILGLYLENEGYNVERVVTFGQPRFTTQELDATSLSNTTRVVNDRDLVPMIPPHSVFGAYQHSSPEVILREASDYVYLEKHDADRLSVGDFWRNITNFSLGDHHMDRYLRNIEIKTKSGSNQVPYLQRAAPQTHL